MSVAFPKFTSESLTGIARAGQGVRLDCPLRFSAHDLIGGVWNFERFPFRVLRFAWLLLALSIPNPAWAYVLDWSNEAPNIIQNGSADNLRWRINDVDNSGIDVIIQFTFQNPAGQEKWTPDASNGNQEGPWVSTSIYPEESVRLLVNFQDDNDRLRIRITFKDNATGQNALVENVQFDLYDIDSGVGGGPSFRDRTRNFRANDTTPLSAGFGPDLALSWRPGAPELSGSGITQSVTGQSTIDNDSNLGTVGVDFGSEDMFRLQFIYDNGQPVDSNPANQAIGLGNLRFDVVVPEADPAIVLTCGFLVLGLGRYFKPSLRRIRRAF